MLGMHEWLQPTHYNGGDYTVMPSFVFDSCSRNKNRSERLLGFNQINFESILT